MRNWKKEILSIPNILSLFRLLLIPVYTVLFLRAERPVDYWWAAGILAVSTLTDMVDGKIARRFHMVTNLGKILDPVADKATSAPCWFAWPCAIRFCGMYWASLWSRRASCW